MRCKGFVGAVAHLRRDMKIGPEGGGGEEAGDHGIEPGGNGGALAGKVRAHQARADHAEVAAQLGEIPAVAAEDADAHARLDDGINLAGDGEDEGGFSASVGAEDGHVLAGADGEIDVVEHDAVAAGHVDLAQREELRFVFRQGLRLAGEGVLH